MKPANKTRSVRLLVVALIAVSAVAISSVAMAASGPSTINTCTKLNKKGVVGKTKITTASSCTGTSVFQTWEPQQAPVSLPIYSEYASASVFLVGPPIPIASLTIPTAGPFSVSAVTTLVNGAVSGSTIFCTLEGPGGATTEDSVVQAVPIGLSDRISLLMTDHFTSGETVTLSCSQSVPGNSAEYTRIVATAGTSLTMTGS